MQLALIRLWYDVNVLSRCFILALKRKSVKWRWFAPPFIRSSNAHVECVAIHFIHSMHSHVTLHCIAVYHFSPFSPHHNARAIAINFFFFITLFLSIRLLLLLMLLLLLCAHHWFLFRFRRLLVQNHLKRKKNLYLSMFLFTNQQQPLWICRTVPKWEQSIYIHNICAEKENQCNALYK